jgi:hypothetical protein
MSWDTLIDFFENEYSTLREESDHINEFVDVQGVFCVGQEVYCNIILILFSKYWNIFTYARPSLENVS